jgi:hypothetical protein
MLPLYVAWLLALAGFAFLPLVILSFLRLLPTGAWIEVALMSSFVSSVVLMIWMFLACLRDPSLDAKERLRWELLLVAGGPITAIVYLNQKLSRR